MKFPVFSLILALIILFLFLFISGKVKWEKDSGLTFECGFTSSFVSRFSFSMHFFTIGLVFLFLDLELCLIMPYFNESFSSFKILLLSWMFIGALLMGLIYEWATKELDWKF